MFWCRWCGERVESRWPGWELCEACFQAFRDFERLDDYLDRTAAEEDVG